MKAYGGMEVYNNSLLLAKQEEEGWTASHKGGGAVTQEVLQLEV
jgi:hypothetical protein